MYHAKRGHFQRVRAQGAVANRATEFIGHFKDLRGGSGDGDEDAVFTSLRLRRVSVNRLELNVLMTDGHLAAIPNPGMSQRRQDSMSSGSGVIWCSGATPENASPSPMGPFIFNLQTEGREGDSSSRRKSTLLVNDNTINGAYHPSVIGGVAFARPELGSYGDGGGAAYLFMPHIDAFAVSKSWTRTPTYYIVFLEIGDEDTSVLSFDLQSQQEANQADAIDGVSPGQLSDFESDVGAASVRTKARHRRQRAPQKPPQPKQI